MESLLAPFLLSLVLSTSPALEPHPLQTEPLRVLVAVAPSLRQQPLWRGALERALDGAVRLLEPTLARDLEIVEVQPWLNGRQKRPLESMLRQLEKTVMIGRADVVIGFAASFGDPLQRPPPRFFPCRDRGIANYDTGYIVISLGSSLRGVDLLLAHEIAHLFGALDRQESRSLMDPTSPGTEVGPLNAELISLHANRTFGGDTFPLGGPQRSRLRHLYERAKLGGNEAAALEARFHLARLHNEDSRYDEATKELRAVLLAAPDLAVAHGELGYSYLMTGDLERAAAATRSALQLSPALSRAWLNLGVIAAQEGRFSSAARHFERAISSDPAYGDAYENLGNARLALRDLSGAERAYVRSLETGAPNGQVHNNLATIYFDRSSFERAWQHARQASAFGFEPHPDFVAALEHATGRKWPPR